MPFIDEISARLVAQAVGTLESNIFTSSHDIIPSGTGPYLSIIETGGSSPSLTQVDTATENPTAQLSCRATDPVLARAMLKAAYNALGGANGLHNVVLSGTAYLKIKPRQSITDVGEESATGRAMYVFNIEAEKQPS